MSSAPRRLILMRHAKSAWNTDAPTDHARPLNKRGRRDAPRVAAALVDAGWTPDWVVSSDSERTRETFARMAPALLDIDAARVRFDARLYHAGPDELREVLAELPASALTVLTLGHNPGWEEALMWLSGADEVMKTATAAMLVTDAPDWAAATSAPGRFRMEEILYPRELG